MQRPRALSRGSPTGSKQYCIFNVLANRFNSIVGRKTNVSDRSVGTRSHMHARVQC